MGLFREKIRAGAFKRTLDAGTDVVALAQHDATKPLGRRSAGTLTLAEDATGLRVDITPPDTSYARDLLESIKRGDVRGMSFGFEATADKWSDDPKLGLTRELVEVDLLEVSAVTFPAYPDTSVAVRAIRARKLQSNANRLRLATAGFATC